MFKCVIVQILFRANVFDVLSSLEILTSLSYPTPQNTRSFRTNKLKREQCSSATVAQRERERERGGKRGTLGAINSVHRRWCQLHVMAV